MIKTKGKAQYLWGELNVHHLQNRKVFFNIIKEDNPIHLLQQNKNHYYKDIEL